MQTKADVLAFMVFPSSAAASPELIVFPLRPAKTLQQCYSPLTLFWDQVSEEPPGTSRSQAREPYGHFCLPYPQELFNAR